MSLRQYSFDTTLNVLGVPIEVTVFWVFDGADVLVEEVYAKSDARELSQDFLNLPTHDAPPNFMVWNVPTRNAALQPSQCLLYPPQITDYRENFYGQIEREISSHPTAYNEARNDEAEWYYSRGW